MIFYPPIKLIEKNVKFNRDQLNNIKNNFNNSTLALIILSAAVPSVIIILITLTMTYLRKFKFMKNQLTEMDEKMETILGEEKETTNNE